MEINCVKYYFFVFKERILVNVKFGVFLKDKIMQICIILFAIITVEIFLLVYPYGNFIRIYIPVVIFGGYFISIFFEFFNKKRYYENIYRLLEELEEKYLITELIKGSNFIEGKILKDLLGTINKSMIENVNRYKYLQEDYEEYIEMWIHEIKIPIATSKMVIENNKNDATMSINEELDKVENYIQQALYYARSNTVNKDYYIKKSSLKEIVNECIKKNKTILIGDKITIDAHDLNIYVNTDIKWIVFILNQIIQNSIKYKKNEVQSKIEFYSKQGKENVILYIKDNGMGIKVNEVSRVFEKGFTGTNGRVLNKKSTGIGLYLCRKLCNKLGIAIELESVQGEGTEVRLVFPNSSYMELK